MKSTMHIPSSPKSKAAKAHYVWEYFAVVSFQTILILKEDALKMLFACLLGIMKMFRHNRRALAGDRAARQALHALLFRAQHTHHSR
jgi:hypothetical protein